MSAAPGSRDDALSAERPLLAVGPADSAADTAADAAESESPRERRRAEWLRSRQAEILAAAEELFAVHGYAGTSLEKIAAACGYSAGSIYNFFPNKDAVYTAVLDSHAQVMAAHVRECADGPGTGMDKLLAMASTAVVHMRRFPDRARFTFGALVPRRAPTVQGQSSTRVILEVYALAIREGQQDGTIRGGDPFLLAGYVGGLILAHAGADPEMGHPNGVRLADFLRIVRGALAPDDAPLEPMEV